MGCLLHPATQLWDKAALDWKRKGPLKRCLRDLVGWEPGNCLGCGWRDQCEIAELWHIHFPFIKVQGEKKKSFFFSLHTWGNWGTETTWKLHSRSHTGPSPSVRQSLTPNTSFLSTFLQECYLNYTGRELGHKWGKRFVLDQHKTWHSRELKQILDLLSPKIMP